ncbi:MAG: type II secretion system protein GspG [Pirellulales bacterium]
MLKRTALATITLCMMLECGCRLATMISQTEMTQTRLTGTMSRIAKFHEANARLPASPDELPNESNRDCSLDDGWGRPLIWNSNGIDTISLKSYGKDGLPGGTGENADQVSTFNAAKP